MKVTFVSSEIFPYAKTGGLADVSGSLPKALSKLDCNVKIFMPKYYSIDNSKFELQYNNDIGEFGVQVGSHKRLARILNATLPGSMVEIYLIDCPHYFHRDSLYTDGCDEDERFIFFNKAVIEILKRINWIPDIIHCNDWQTGLIPLYIKNNFKTDGLFDSTAALFTIHNIEYQGLFSKHTLKHANIDDKLFYPTGPVEFFEKVSFLKTGIVFSDVINTVSNTYAKELLTSEFGAGMENILIERKNDFFGILNGANYTDWDPETDSCIPYKYSAKDLSGKLKNKKYLSDRFKLIFNQDLPLIGMVSRMVDQKGFDIFQKIAEDLMKLDANWIILGSGESEYENMFRLLEEKYPSKVSVHIGYNDELSHLIEAAADIFLMPSHFEPCGLNQIYSLKYGTVPVVRKTGGLADTVFDWDDSKMTTKTGTGFLFKDYTGKALIESVNRALKTFRDKKSWDRIRKNGMVMDYSWNISAKEYLNLYEIALDRRGKRK